MAVHAVPLVPGRNLLKVPVFGTWCLVLALLACGVMESVLGLLMSVEFTVHVMIRLAARVHSHSHPLSFSLSQLTHISFSFNKSPLCKP